MGWKGKEVSMPDRSGKAPIHHHELPAVTVLRWGLFVNLYILRENFIYRVFFLFEILYLRCKKSNSFSGCKMEVQLNGVVLWGKGADMREYLLLNMKIKHEPNASS